MRWTNALLFLVSYVRASKQTERPNQAAGFKAKLRTEPQPQPHPPCSVSTAAVPATWQLDGLQLDLVGGLQP